MTHPRIFLPWPIGQYEKQMRKCRVKQHMDCKPLNIYQLVFAMLSPGSGKNQEFLIPDFNWELGNNQEFPVLSFIINLPTITQYHIA